MSHLPQHVQDVLAKLPPFPAKDQPMNYGHFSTLSIEGKLVAAVKSLSVAVINVGHAIREANMLHGLDGGARLRQVEQHILRAHHGTRDEYVWSETLRGHVRIGGSA